MRGERWAPLGYRTLTQPKQGDRACTATGEPSALARAGRLGRGPRRQPTSTPRSPAARPPFRAPPRGRAGPPRRTLRAPLPPRPAGAGAGARAGSRLLQGPGGEERGPPTDSVTCSCPRHLRGGTARERSPAHGEGEGAAPPARRGGGGGKFGKRLAPAGRSGAPPRRAGSGRSRSLPPPPVVRGSSPLPSPSPRGVGVPGSPPLSPPALPPSGRRRGAAPRRGERPGVRGGGAACGDVTCQRARRARARQSRGRQEVPGGSGRQFPRKNLPHSLNVNDSKKRGAAFALTFP